MDRHPSTLDHSPDTLIRLAEACRDASHEGDKFDELQEAANALQDWASLRLGDNLVGLEGERYPLPIETR